MYSYKRETHFDQQTAIKRIKEELSKEGFGVLTEIDVKETLKKKLGVNFDSYTILGVCNPPLAHKALESEKEIGLLLPCNVIVYKQKGKTIISAIKPTSLLNMIDNEKLTPIAQEAEEKLKRSIDKV